MDNKAATLHMLTSEEREFIKLHIEQYLLKMKEIKEKSNLTGQWAISQDYKFLVKQGE